MIKNKLIESLQSVLPIALIVLFISFTLVPMSPSSMILFVMGVVFLVIGMSLFTSGAEMSMQTLGSKIGSSIASSGKIWLIAFVSFIIGILVTISEPDLQIMATQVGDVENIVLILTVSVGVGIFLMIALLRIVLGISLNVILIVFYIAAITLSFFLPEGFRTLAFDSGGVTTGPMTVPFIMSIGAGVCAARSNPSPSRDDSFGITALCSIGPIIAVLVLGIVMKVDGGTYVPEQIVEITDTREGIIHYFNEFLEKFGGNIGYSVRPSERGKGFGTMQLQAALRNIGERGVEQALLTCDEDNAASAAIILSCGGVEDAPYTCADGSVQRRFWIALPKPGYME